MEHNDKKKWLSILPVTISLLTLAFGSGLFFRYYDCSGDKTIRDKQETTPKKIIQTTVGLNIGDRVISRNTTDDDGNRGVRIRYTPEITSGNHKGWLFDEATGEIIDGPIYEDNHVWWKVSWDPGLGTGKVNCGNIDPCIGWTAETVKGGLVLNKK